MSPDRDKFPDDRPETPDPDIDAAFAQIIAGWDDVAPTPDGAGATTADGAGEDPADGAPGAHVDPPVAPAPAPTPAPLPGPPTPGPRDWAAVEEVEEGYVPPEPPPIPHGDLTSRLAWAGVVLGPAFLLLCAFAWKDVGRLWLAAAAVAFVAGFVTLVMRLPASRDGDSDDGAVV